MFKKKTQTKKRMFHFIFSKSIERKRGRGRTKTKSDLVVWELRIVTECQTIKRQHRFSHLKLKYFKMNQFA